MADQKKAAWRAQAESLARAAGSARSPQKSDPSDDIPADALRDSPPLLAGGSPPPGSPPPGAEVGTIDLTDEDGAVTRLRADGAQLTVEILGNRVDPSLRTVREVIFFRDSNHLRFGCAEPDWNICLPQQGEELARLYAQLSGVCGTAGIPLVSDTYRYVSSGPNQHPMLIAVGPRGGPVGEMPPPQLPDQQAVYAQYLAALGQAQARGTGPSPYNARGGYPRPRGGGGWRGRGRGRGGWSSGGSTHGPIIAEIEGLLVRLGEEKPQGLWAMPLSRLREYREYLLQRRAEVSAEGGEPEKAKVAAADLTAGAVVRYVGGGRYNGRREWKDGDVLDVGMAGVIAAVDRSNEWPYLVHWAGLWPTRLSARDLEHVAASPEEAELRITAAGAARAEAEWGADDGEWDAAARWEPPPPRPEGRPTGPASVEKHVMRFDSPPGRGGRGRGGA